jgi:hypothetical protein
VVARNISPLDGELLLLGVAGGEVEAVLDVLVGLGPVDGELGLEAVARYPVGEVLGAEEVADAEGAHDLLRGQGADLRVGIGEAAVAEDLVAVEAAGDHLHLEADLVHLLLEGAQRLGAIAVRVLIVGRVHRVPGDYVVVVGRGVVDEALGLGVAEDIASLERRDGIHDAAAEGIAAGALNAPERHGKLSLHSRPSYK